MHSALTILLLVYAGQTPDDDPVSRVEQCATAFRENASLFESFQMEYTWNNHSLPALLLTDQAFADAYEELLQPSITIRDDKLAELRQTLSGRHHSDEDLKKEFGRTFSQRHKDRIRQLQGLLQSPEASSARRFEIRCSPERISIRAWQSEPHDGTGKLVPHASLTSITGGEFSVTERKAGSRWISLDPLPAIHKRHVTVGSKLLLDCLVPALIPTQYAWQRGPVGMHDLQIDQFWKDSGQIQSLGETTFADGSTVQLLCKPIAGTNHCHLAAIDLSLDGMPRWLCRFEPTDRSVDLRLLSAQQAASIANRIEFYRNQDGPGLERLGIPASTLYFDDYVKVEEAGWYPFRIVSKKGAAVPTKDQILASLTGQSESMPTSDVAFAQLEMGTLVVTSMKINPVPEEWSSIVLNDGTKYWDTDRQQDAVVASQQRAAMERLTPHKRTISSRLLIMNAVVLIAFLVTMSTRLWRARTQ